MRLKENVVIVTGGSRGMGRAYCITMAREGANVMFNIPLSQGAGI